MRPSMFIALCALVTLASFGRFSMADEGSQAIKPFNGKDLAGWRTKTGSPEETLKVGRAKLNPDKPRELIVEEGEGELINFKSGGRDFFTEQKFGDARIELEFMVPQGSNSGVYVMGEYELQILDSYGRERVGPGDVGGLYGAQAPRVNASKPPGEWQKFVIDFRAPTFDAEGKKTGNATFKKVTLNDQVIHEDVEMKGVTPGGLTGKEHATGPLMVQGDHGPVAIRNIKIILVE